MLTLCSFLHGAFLFVKSLAVRVAKSDYRRKAVLASAGVVFAVVAFTSSGFGGGGKNALTVFAETGSEPEKGGGEEEEEMEPITEADIRIELTDQIQESRQIVGDLMAQKMRREERKRNLTREKIDDIREQVRQEEIEAERTAKELAEAEAERLAEKARQLEQERQRKEEEAGPAAAAVPMSREDYQVLLRIVQAEAGICDEKGKILVANVIFNRVRSDEFPDTVTKVVYQKSQFSPVADGSINTCRVTQETVDCVDRAIRGEDYSQGALYFMNRRGASSGNARWFDSHLTYLFSHERHEFFR